MVQPFDDRDIIAGQGTAGLELVEQAAAIDARPDLVLVPCGGGGLVSGIATAVKPALPNCRVMAVEPEGFDDFTRSLASGRPERNARLGGSICDALLSPEPGVITLAACLEHAVTGIAVAEGDVRGAVAYAFGQLKLVVEPGGAIALAALLSGRVPVAGRTAVVVLSGGNVDPSLFASIIAETAV